MRLADLVIRDTPGQQAAVPGAKTEMNVKHVRGTGDSKATKMSSWLNDQDVQRPDYRSARPTDLNSSLLPPDGSRSSWRPGRDGVRWSGVGEEEGWTNGTVDKPCTTMLRWHTQQPTVCIVTISTRRRRHRIDTRARFDTVLRRKARPSAHASAVVKSILMSNDALKCNRT
jgi:hypothetical protein